MLPWRRGSAARNTGDQGEQKGSAAEQDPNLVREIILGERLGQEGCAGLEQTVFEHFGSKAGHVEDGLSRPTLLDMPAELPAAHPGHLYISQDEMNAAGMLLDRGYGFPPMTRFERLIARPGQHTAG
jgi:hypothetical protein